MDTSELNARYWSEIPAGEITSAGAIPGQELLERLAVGAAILDIGCGNGRIAEHLAERGHQVTAIDINAGAITRNRARQTTVRYEVADLRAPLPLPDAAFDAACSCFVLGNIFPHAVRAQVIGELVRVLRPGGLVWIREALISEDFTARYEASLGDPHDLRAVTPSGKPRVTHHFSLAELDLLFGAFERVSFQESITISPHSGFRIRTGTMVYRVLGVGS